MSMMEREFSVTRVGSAEARSWSLRTPALMAKLLLNYASGLALLVLGLALFGPSPANQ
ncbi:MAG: hypothetical protein NT154_32210 [Verrucomicrobia bacterium]|nr:hypothetical protein [Verrucomicrobiota bacterium]